MIASKFCMLHSSCDFVACANICGNQMTRNWINTLRLRQNGCHFPEDIFKYIFLNENTWISIKISLKFVPKGSNNNIAALVQIMAWCRPGDKPLSELMTVSLLMHICVTRPQWVKAMQIFHQIWIAMKNKLSGKWAPAHMMTSLNGNIFHVTCPLCGEFTGHRWTTGHSSSQHT